uniref:Uncharacterized protein n=1 Tax=Oryza nivara TaxID=4536 RepID=A0A0E0J156_ORYNI
MPFPSLFPSSHQSFRLPRPLPVLLLSTAPDDAAADAVLAHLADRGYGRDLRLVAELRIERTDSTVAFFAPCAAASGGKNRQCLVPPSSTGHRSTIAFLA